MNSDEYLEFLQKFEAKKTTDDCYTPPNIYDAVRDWAASEYALEGRPIVRPFHPDGDYQQADYPPDCVVLDNPPFSILSEICKWYNWKGIDYLLFAPNLTLFNGHAPCAIISDCSVMYTNGAEIKTSFLTSLDPAVFRSAPDLQAAVNAANAINRTQHKAELPKYIYPANLVTAARLNKIAKVPFAVMPKDCGPRIGALERQKREGKGIFGGGYLISDKAAAELKAAELKAAELKAAKLKAAVKSIEWELGSAELELIERLNNGRPIPENGELFK